MNNPQHPIEKIKEHLASFSRCLHLPHEPAIVCRQNPIELIKNCQQLKHIQWNLPEEWFMDQLKYFATEPPENKEPEWHRLSLNYIGKFMNATAQKKQYHLGMFDESVNVTNLGTISESRAAIIRDFLDEYCLELLYVTAYHNWDPIFAVARSTLPLMHSLILKCSSYSGPSRYDFLEMLDFSDLQRLALVDTQINVLIDKVNVRYFSHLRALHITVSAYPPKEMERNHGNAALEKMFETFHRLEVLYISFFGDWTQVLPLSTIRKKGMRRKFLQKLSLRNTKTGLHPPGEEMRKLNTSCPSIEELTVDLQWARTPKSSDYLNAIAAFQNLHTLSLYSSTIPDSPHCDINDHRVRAAEIVNGLQSKKHGVKFREITIRLRWIASNKSDAWRDPTDFDRGFRTFYTQFDTAGGFKQWNTEEAFKGKTKKKQNGVDGGSDEAGYESDSTIYGELGGGSVLKLA
ncbi:uncharacterized protein PAC_17468 [Phialocephala subalpina]|uniref:Uncharacterized protein n=1 Tax=Phialocephala subalpina TaxID=576137 RepID=A0A1L7XRD7_9HELO|nr:uncharacterized protein PAC_17468 [Phialocephala subalpina]